MVEGGPGILSDVARLRFIARVAGVSATSAFSSAVVVDGPCNSTRQQIAQILI